MKKLLLIGTMLAWSGAAAAQYGGPDQCPQSALPVVEQTDVATVERNSDNSSAVIQLDVVASLAHGDSGDPSYSFTSQDGTITGDGPHATWSVAGAGPFTASVAVTAPSGCRSYARFTYHMEQTASE